MADYDMSGILFPNRYKQPGDKKPDYTGSITIHGSKWDLAAWERENDKGTFLSLKVSEPRQQNQPQSATASQSDENHRQSAMGAVRNSIERQTRPAGRPAARQPQDDDPQF